MPVFIVSACLAGIPCRYDGRANTCAAVVELVRRGLAVPVCPEGLAELPVPRPPCEIAGDRVLRRDGVDLTEAFERGAQRALELALRHGCRRAVVKSRSPSCGAGRIYDGTFSGQLCDGDGLWVRLLRRHGVEVGTEEDVAEAVREAERTNTDSNRS
ncbi:DUF523 domain-containing protein [uncultured Desulfovibrio sp.]|uniref:DUF523 domain-containing protein n=1 Tax=uncultured Desulfovibrio sp. TaxID=167968 RepID=UPI0026071CF8|nr:DUF523 domain-containing protein [uncultured Desulfovibrio sp.]